MTDNPYEDPSNDGVTGYDHPTDGDVTYLKHDRTASDHYSLLPGNRNERLMPIYTPGLSQDEIDWMVSHSDPMISSDSGPVRASTSWIWEDV
jgi:hypothetical protein